MKESKIGVIFKIALVVLLCVSMVIGSGSITAFASKLTDYVYESETDEEVTLETTEEEAESSELYDEEGSITSELHSKDDIVEVMEDVNFSLEATTTTLTGFIPRYSAPGRYEGYYNNSFLYSNGNCTWYVYGRTCEILNENIGTNRLNGNGAQMWGCRNNFAGSSTDINAPRPGSIICWSGGDGHAAIIEEVADGKVRISESSSNGVWYANSYWGTRWLNINELSNLDNYGLYFQGYIYLLDNGYSGNNPEGCIDGVSGGLVSINVGGWAFDRDNTSESLQIHVYIGGPAGNGEGHVIIANESRDDVNAAYGCGSNHGFSSTISTSKRGSQDVYLYAINIGARSDTYLGCRTVNILSDTQAPTISNVKISNLGKDGYTVSCTVTDNVGIDRVQFPTWTLYNEQDDLVSNWMTSSKASGHINGNQATYQVKITDHNNEQGWYCTHIYAIDTSGNSNVYNISTIMVDGTSPKVVSASISSFDKDGYTVTASATDNVGVTKILFPTWYSGDGEADIRWIQGSPVSGGNSSCRVNVSDFNNYEGDYTTEVRAYDACGNVSVQYHLEINIDRSAPIISDVTVKQIAESGYEVTAKITDENLLSDVYSNTICSNKSFKGRAKKEGNYYTFAIEAAQLDNQYGSYVTTIYAKDIYDNETLYECDAQEISENIDDCKVVFNSMGGTEVSPVYVK